MAATGRSRRTKVIRVDAGRPDPSVIREAAHSLACGGLVVFPTETVYGLGADATDSRAVRAVFEAKGRPPDNPLIVHIWSPEDIAGLVTEVPPAAAGLMSRFWPGPLSLVLRRAARVAEEVSRGLDTVAVRMPAHPVALELIRLAGVPVAAPSANVSGRPSPTRAADALADLDGLVDYVLDAGPCPVGVESTVLDLTGSVPVVLRPGGVTVEELREVLGNVQVLEGPATRTRPPGGPGVAVPDAEAAARSPGLRHRHYAPRARLVLVLPDTRRPDGPERTAAVVARVVAGERASGRTVGVACARETADLLGRAGDWRSEPLPVVAWGARNEPGEIAARLFAVLRDLDRQGVDVIIAEGSSSEGLGRAVNDRLGRAAAEVIEAGDDGGPPAETPDTILLICSGNTCRSPMAAAILNDHLRRAGLDRAYRAESAGVFVPAAGPASPEAVQVMAERGLDLGNHVARQVTAELLDRTRLILTMTGAHKEAVLALAPGVADRVFTLKGYAGDGAGSGQDVGSIASRAAGDISDPIGLGLEVYREAADEIEKAVARVVERLTNLADLRELIGEPEGPGEEKQP